jgi:hypothetical protein
MKYELMIESSKQVFREDVAKALEAVMEVLLRSPVEILYFREVKQ